MLQERERGGGEFGDVNCLEGQANISIRRFYPAFSVVCRSRRLSTRLWFYPSWKMIYFILVSTPDVLISHYFLAGTYSSVM